MVYRVIVALTEALDPALRWGMTTEVRIDTKQDSQQATRLLGHFEEAETPEVSPKVGKVVQVFES